LPSTPESPLPPRSGTIVDPANTAVPVAFPPAAVASSPSPNCCCQAVPDAVHVAVASPRGWCTSAAALGAGARIVRDGDGDRPAKMLSAKPLGLVGESPSDDASVSLPTAPGGGAFLGALNSLAVSESVPLPSSRSSPSCWPNLKGLRQPASHAASSDTGSRAANKACVLGHQVQFLSRIMMGSVCLAFDKERDSPWTSPASCAASWMLQKKGPCVETGFAASPGRGWPPPGGAWSWRRCQRHC
jgi:hypothetical protein